MIWIFLVTMTVQTSRIGDTELVSYHQDSGLW